MSRPAFALPLLTRQADRTPALLPPLALLFCWLVVTRWRLLPPQVIPGPGAVLHAFATMAADGTLLANVAVTVWLLVAGFALGAASGAAIGLAIGLSPRVRDYLLPAMQAMSYIPVLGWLPIWLLVIGIGTTLNVVLVAQAAAFPIIFGTYAGVRDVAPEFRELGAVLKLTRWQMLRRIVLPAAFPLMWSSIRFGLTKAWMALVTVELLASTAGLGFLMTNARSLYRVDVMFVTIFLIGAFGILLDAILQFVEDRVLFWQGPAGRSGQKGGAR